MGLFDDDFYSTKVSRHTRSSRRDERAFSNKRNRGNWSNVRIAAISSVSSAVVATLIFGVFIGGSDGGGGSKGAQVATAAVSADSMEQRTIQASAKVRPTVVSVINKQTLGFNLLPQEGKDEDASDRNLTGSLQEAGVGSGVIFKKQDGKAYIITNYHVIADAEVVEVVLLNGERRTVKVVGGDQISDIAVLEMSAEGINTVAELGDSSKLHPAEFVIAIGNPLGLGDSLTIGIVSKIGQVVPVSLNQDGVYDWEQEVIQVDASINQGNSGGPLIDLNGHVIGINSMKISDVGVEGLGFAIPINTVMPIVDSIMDQGYVSRPYLGVYTIDLEQYFAQQELMNGAGAEGEKSGDDDVDVNDAESLKLPDEVYDGVIVLEAVGPAADAGLLYNDVIVKLDKQSIGSTLELRKYLYNKKKIGEEIEVTYYRGGKINTTKFKLAEKTNEE